jgi:hypothetical protein
VLGINFTRLETIQPVWHKFEFEGEIDYGFIISLYEQLFEEKEFGYLIL